MTRQFIRLLAMLVACAVPTLPGLVAAQATTAIPPGLTTPDQIRTRIGTLDFKDGAPSVATAETVRDTLDFINAVNVFNNSFRGASAYAIRKGFHGIGAQDNTVVIFPDLMDAKSLFLTANADTVYYLAVVDLTKGPMVVEQPPGSGIWRIFESAFIKRKAEPNDRVQARRAKRAEVEKAYVIGKSAFDAAIRSTPVVANGVMFVMTEKALYALEAKK